MEREHKFRPEIETEALLNNKTWEFNKFFMHGPATLSCCCCSVAEGELTSAPPGEMARHEVSGGKMKWSCRRQKR